MIRTIVIGLLALVVVALVVGVSQAGTIIKRGTEDYGPEVLHVPVTLENVDFSIFSGAAELTGFSLGQPKGYESGTMVGLDDFVIKLRPATLFSDHIIIDEIVIDSPKLGAQYLGGELNFSAFQKALGLPASAETESPGGTEAATTLTIHKLTVTGATVGLLADGLVSVDETVTLADFELTALGTDEEGLSPAEIARHITDFLMPQVAKAMIETGLKDKINGLKDQGIEKIGNELKKQAGDNVGGLIEGAVGGLLGGQKKDDTQNDEGSGN